MSERSSTPGVLGPENPGEVPDEDGFGRRQADLVVRALRGEPVVDHCHHGRHLRTWCPDCQAERTCGVGGWVAESGHRRHVALELAHALAVKEDRR